MDAGITSLTILRIDQAQTGRRESNGDGRAKIENDRAAAAGVRILETHWGKEKANKRWRRDGQSGKGAQQTLHVAFKILPTGFMVLIIWGSNKP